MANLRQWKLKHEKGEFSYAEFRKDVHEWCIEEMPQVEKLQRKTNSREDTAYHAQDTGARKRGSEDHQRPYKAKGTKHCDYH